MKKSLLVANLAVITANVLGMISPEQNERRSSVNMVSISESSEKMSYLRQIVEISPGGTTD
jgi:hypothetical protein